MRMSLSNIAANTVPKIRTTMESYNRFRNSNLRRLWFPRAPTGPKSASQDLLAIAVFLANKGSKPDLSFCFKEVAKQPFPDGQLKATQLG